MSFVATDFLKAIRMIQTCKLKIFKSWRFYILPLKTQGYLVKNREITENSLENEHT